MDKNEAKQRDPEAREAKQHYNSSDRRNSSIVVGPNTINTIAGPINEWACICLLYTSDAADE